MNVNELQRVDLKSQEAKDGREKATSRYKVIAPLMAMICVTLFILALVAATKYPKAGFGPPYFIGGFVVGPLGLLQAITCFYVIKKASDAASDDMTKLRELGCAMTGHTILSMFLIMGCFMGVVMAGIGGFNSSFRETIPAKPKALATCILVGCLLALALNIIGMCVSCTYGAYFGVRVQGRRQQFVFINQTGNTGYMNSNPTAVHMFTSGPQANPQPYPPPAGGNSSDEQVRNLEAQNRLLQQQLELQQQLINQQQQQQPAQPYGFQPYGATAPSAPVYSTQPDAPPPSYDKVAM